MTALWRELQNGANQARAFSGFDRDAARDVSVSITVMRGIVYESEEPDTVHCFQKAA
ncbi:MAG: hypothetical protein ACYCTF_05660 [Acidiferrobacter sp.]